MKNFILVAGSVNMDIVVDVERLPAKGETVSGRTIRYVPGGKGANQAVAASRLGAEVALIGKVGQDHFGDQLVSFLKSEKLHVEGLARSPLSSGLAVITVDSNGQNTIVVLPGSNAEVKGQYIEKHIGLLKKAHIVISQYEIPIPSVERLFTAARKLHKTTLLNPAPALKTPVSLLKKVDYLVLNEIELSFLANSSSVLEDMNDIVKAAKVLRLKGPRAVVVTIGARGAVTVTDKKVIRTEGIKVRAVDTTAAGDCFIGALAVQLHHGAELKEALAFANRAAALSVQRWGASSSLPYLKEIE